MSLAGPFLFGKFSRCERWLQKKNSAFEKVIPKKRLIFFFLLSIGCGVFVRFFVGD